MDQDDNIRDSEKFTATKGLIFKSANIANQEVSDEDLTKINKYTLVPVTKDEIFAFKITLGDNETDDRNYEPFNLNALKDLQKLYIGKALIKDHNRKADNQIARIYDTELAEEEKFTKANEKFTKLVAKCYMIKTQSNADLISEIKAGIKKEVSTNCRPKHAYCSICGTDNTKSYCSHYHGRFYDTVNGRKQCYFTLDGAKEAYEVSFVVVPAQPRAGTTKNFCDNLEVDKTEMVTQEQEQQENLTDEDNENIKEKEQELELRFKFLSSFLFEQNQKEMEISENE